MHILVKISWRNIWRNPRRTLIMVVAITTGLWAGLFVSALMNGMLRIRFETAIEQQFSHIQIHNPDFLKNQNLKDSIGGWESLRQRLTSDTMIAAFTGRTVASAMLATATQTRGINLIGIDPLYEAQTTGLAKNVVEGDFLNESLRNPVLVGKSLAEKTNLRVGSRIVITFQSIDGALVSSAFRVAGLYRTANSSLDERQVYVVQNYLAEHIGHQQVVNEVALLLNDHQQVDLKKEALQAAFPDLLVRTWADLSPELSYLEEMGYTMLMIILAIILLALTFGLVNTMLMSVYERVYEIGMLMAIGMNRKRIFSMIMLETVFLTFIGAFSGMGLGYFTARILNKTGLDLGPLGAEALETFGYPSVVYPSLEPAFLVQLTVLIAIMVFITALFPIAKAIRLKPAVAVRND